MGFGDSDPLDAQTPAGCLRLTLVGKELWKGNKKVANLEKSLAESNCIIHLNRVREDQVLRTQRSGRGDLYHGVLLRYLGSARGKVVFLSLRIVPPRRAQQSVEG